MNVIEFLDYMKENFSFEKIENNQDNFFENLFYFKRNIRDFIISFKTYPIEEQKKIISFLLQLYPLSDSFLVHILKEGKTLIDSEIMTDTINYICSAFLEELGNLNLEFDEEINKNLKRIFEIRDIIDFNELKLSKFLATRRELSLLKEKDEKLTKEIKELESGSIVTLKEEIAIKQKKYDELKNEDKELSKQFEKLKSDLNELNKYADVRNRLESCRDILKDLNLPKDFVDKK